MNAAGNTRSSAERGPPPKPGLRRSYTRAVLAAGVVLAIPSGLLAAAGSGAAAAGVLVPAWLWFFLMVRVLRGQLSLVRPPGSYRLYDRFLPSNGLTLLRLLAAPLVALAVAWGPAEPLARWTVFVLYTAVALTDVLDGWLARSRNECSVFGRTFDHVTDVALGTFLTLALWWAGLLPDWFVVLCLVRFLLPVLGGGVFWMKEVAWRI
ncbi:MAG: CDP-alcohol phosphatidyltransferase family protein, partial [Deltaproteobacteria bacterium]|nr:CDP-alcohol phosphatidyltransferase family protein [Deltaproteobacteria bacterium]